MIFHQGILNCLETDTQFKSFIKKYEENNEATQVAYGLIGSQKSFFVAGIYQKLQAPLVIIVADEETGLKLKDDLATFFPEKVDFFPEKEIVNFKVFAHSKDTTIRRLNVISKLLHQKLDCLITTGEALLQKLIPKELFINSFFKLEIGQIFDWEELLQKFTILGYERVDLVEAPGQFSVRGGIIDIFFFTEQYATRIEFFGDEIDSIRYFDTENQKSLENVEKIICGPAREIILTPDLQEKGIKLIEKDLEIGLKRLDKLKKYAEKEKLEEQIGTELSKLKDGLWVESLERLQPYFYPEGISILDYFRPNPLMVFDEPNRIYDRYEQKNKERQETTIDLLEAGSMLPRQGEMYFTEEFLFKPSQSKGLLYLSALPQKLKTVGTSQNILNFGVKTIAPFMSKFKLLLEELTLWKKGNKKIVIMVKDEERAKYLQNILSDHKLLVPLVENIENLERGTIVLSIGSLEHGFDFPSIGLVVLNEQEIFGKKARKKPFKPKKNADKLTAFTDLKVGDLVVHVNHGIGKYLGIQKLDVGGVYKDYMHIKYAGEDKLYIPTEQIDLVQKYIGGEGHTPKLSKLGGTEWSKAKSKVKASVQDIAKDLLKLYAEREKAVGFQFSPDTIWQQELEDKFPYEETPDQLKAIVDVKRDMEKPRPMDRLVVGDVGYGKTEVAIRAIFKAIMDSKQVAVLVPTTVLAQQHYNTFSQRFADFPIRIGLLNRFRSAKEQKAVLKGLETGSYDLVVGTHRLLSKDIKFKNLGLLVVDEEQKFGVVHKEKLKTLRASVDILTLTATPIPRTLHLALAGGRDLSIIETPPEERFPVQTYVVEYSSELIRDAIRRELNRGGQVYFIHNRIEDLEKIESELRRLVPNARIAIGHGKMKEDELEKAMLAFIEGEYDILLSTTIVENGVDISNANTLIINDADYLGLSQLYQLRGRVGRSNRVAFSYFTYRPNKILNQDAEKRLRTIREFTEFGSGFKIAMRDLEIRGAGNLLGAEQHGHLLSIGFDLYCKLLEEAVDEQRGDLPQKTEKTIQLELDVNAFISDDYIGNTGMKMEFYRRLIAANTSPEVDEVIDELLDRFGELPPAVYNLILIARLRIMGKELDIKGIYGAKKEIRVEFNQFPLAGSELFPLEKHFKGQIVFKAVKGQLHIILKLGERSQEKTLPVLIQLLEKIKLAQSK